MRLDQWEFRYFRSDRYRNKDNTFDDFRNLPRPFVSLGLIKGGSWSYEQNFIGSDVRAAGEIREGEVLYIPQGATYSSVWHAGASVGSECVSLHFELAGSVLNSHRSKIQKLAAYDGIAEDFEYLLWLYHSKSVDDEKALFRKRLDVISRLYGVVSRLVGQIEISADDTDPRLIPALEYLQTHSTEKISAAELASMCYISEPYFYILFKKSVGVPFVEYKNSLVVSKAERMLIESPELTVEAISRSLGFSSGAYFRRVFRHFLGCSPREYRKTGRQS